MKRGGDRQGTGHSEGLLRLLKESEDEMNEAELFCFCFVGSSGAQMGGGVG